MLGAQSESPVLGEIRGFLDGLQSRGGGLDRHG